MKNNKSNTTLFNFKIDNQILEDFKSICVKYQVSYTKMLTLAMKYVIQKDAETKNLVLELSKGSGIHE